MKKIAVLSAGNGGQALAADLALRGHDVALYDLPQFAPVIEAIRHRGNTIELQNKITGTATIRLVTTDIAEALDGAEVVYFTAPSYGQKAFFDLAVPALSDGQVIVLMPGNYGTLALKAALREAGKDVLVAETDNLPYACAATEPGVVNVRVGMNDVSDICRRQAMLCEVPFQRHFARLLCLKTKLAVVRRGTRARINQHRIFAAGNQKRECGNGGFDSCVLE